MRCVGVCWGLVMIVSVMSEAAEAEETTGAPFGASEGLFDASDGHSLGLKQIPVQEVELYRATRDSYRFCHHPNLVAHSGRVWCMWSNGRIGEDEPGQRILYASASMSDLGRWTKPRVLATDPTGKGACVASGWVLAGKTVVALYTVTGGTNFDPATALWARVQRGADGWSEPRRLVPGFFIAAPLRLTDGSLLLAGEHVGDARKTGRMSLLRTEQAAGLGGWQACEIKPADLSVFGYTEPAPFEVGGGRLVSPFRNYSGRLYASESRDGGRTWSRPVKTTFPDSLARHATGRLPGGDYFLINNPSPKRLDRSILTLALSRDGQRFDRAVIIRNAKTSRRFDGKHKLDGWQYPHALVVGQELLVAYSVNKEDVRLSRISCRALKSLR